MRFISFIYPGCIAQHGAHTRVVYSPAWCTYPGGGRGTPCIYPGGGRGTPCIYPGGVYPYYTSGWCISELYLRVGIPGCIYHGGYPRVYIPWWVSQGCTMGYPKGVQCGYPRVYNGRYPRVYNGGYPRGIQWWVSLGWCMAGIPRVVYGGYTSGWCICRYGR